MFRREKSVIFKSRIFASFADEVSGRALSPRCLKPMEADGRIESKSRKNSEGMIWNNIRMAKVPKISTRSGGCDRTNVDQVR